MGTSKRVSQGSQVLNYLSNRGHITQATASSVYGISRLAAVVYSLKQKGHNIATTMKDGVKGQYAEYNLVLPS